MRFLSILLIALSFTAYAQSEQEISVNDTLYFDACDGESFLFIDMYSKTRIEDTAAYSNLEGWDFYNSFFSGGDFDVSRMPCSKQNQYAVIKHIMAVEDTDKNWHNVVIALFPDGYTAAYLIEAAFVEGEVSWAPAK